MKNVEKRVTRVGVYDHHTHIKYLFKALIFGTCKKNILIYSYMRFQLCKSHSLTAIGLKLAKNP